MGRWKNCLYVLRLYVDYHFRLHCFCCESSRNLYFFFFSFFFALLFLIHGSWSLNLKKKCFFLLQLHTVWSPSRSHTVWLPSLSNYQYGLCYIVPLFVSFLLFRFSFATSYYMMKSSSSRKHLYMFFLNIWSSFFNSSKWVWYFFSYFLYWDIFKNQKLY